MPHPIPRKVRNGQKTVTEAGTQLQMPNAPCRGVSIKALAANTGNVYLGDADVSSSTGREMEPGEVVNLNIDNVNRLYLDSAVNGEGVSYLVVV